MALNRADFADYCVVRSVTAGIWPPHILIALAQARSGIDTRAANGLVGPFDFSAQLWDAYRSDKEFDVAYQAGDITLWPAQCTVAAIMVRRAIDRLRAAGKTITLAAIYDQIWPPTAGTPAPDLDAALAATAALVDPAIKAVLGGIFDQGTLGSKSASPVGRNIPGGAAGRPQVNYAAAQVRPERRVYGDQILDAFITAGFGAHHAIAALANAIRESSLNPKDHNGVGEDSWGLFQCNRHGGLGMGHSPDELCDPAINIAIIIAAARKSARFSKAVTLEEAVSGFVLDIERPKDPSGAILLRIRTARVLLS